jgi:hypothetical protein
VRIELAQNRVQWCPLTLGMFIVPSYAVGLISYLANGLSLYEGKGKVVLVLK